MLRISLLTSVAKTRGRVPAVAAACDNRCTHSFAFSTVSTNGTTVCQKSIPSNWLRRLCPSISAVIPVPSEMKNTGRFADGIQDLSFISKCTASSAGKIDLIRSGVLW